MLLSHFMKLACFESLGSLTINDGISDTGDDNSACKPGGVNMCPVLRQKYRKTRAADMAYHLLNIIKSINWGCFCTEAGLGGCRLGMSLKELAFIP